MEIKNIESAKLLPRFAKDIEYILNAFDTIIKRIWGRSISIDAPLTMEAVEALTDEELQALYEQYGLAKYYPDISRARRNWMLFNMARVWRYLGTPAAVEFLCKYIFGDIEISIKVHDNEAFDSGGNLTNPGLLDTFSVEILPETPDLPPEATQRIIENIINFSRNSQAFNEVFYTFEGFVNRSCAIGLPYDDINAVENIENYDICEDSPAPPPVTLPEVSLGGDFGTNNVVYGGGSSPSVTKRSYRSMKLSSGSSTMIRINPDYTYATVWWSNSSSTLAISGRTAFSACGIESTETHTVHLYQLNNAVSDSSRTMYAAKIAVCKSRDVSVLIVIDDQNNQFNAFRYISGGIAYYFVLDELQTDWTSDLSSIGYSLPVSIFPRIKDYGIYYLSGSYYSDSNVNINSNYASKWLIYSSSTTSETKIVKDAYDCAGWVFAIQSLKNGSNTEISLDKAELEWTIDNGGTTSTTQYKCLALKNISSSSITVNRVFLYGCQSDYIDDVSVVKVYDSSNKIYNSYVYTRSGSTYYYVLDGVQADWVTDLSSIGYSLTPS